MKIKFKNLENQSHRLKVVGKEFKVRKLIEDKLLQNIKNNIENISNIHIN